MTPSSRRTLQRSASGLLPQNASGRTAGGRSCIQRAGGLALQLPKSAALAAQEPAAGVFGELDTLLGLGSDRHREHGRVLAADLTRTLDGAVHCREIAASLLSVDEGGWEEAKPDSSQLFAELDGLASSAAAAPRVSPFKREMETLMMKVANESSALLAKHDDLPDPLAYSRDGLESSGAFEEEEEGPELPQMTVECTEPLFAELDTLLHGDPDQQAKFAQAFSKMLESRHQAASVTEQLLEGDEPDDPAHAAWRRSALEFSKREGSSSAKKRATLNTSSSSSAVRPTRSMGGSMRSHGGANKSAGRRSTVSGFSVPASRSGRAMSLSNWRVPVDVAH
mmetsp:Transcript_121870/g.379344  ORF Transcript_121870/g.379344 Transcript_121870/m.379344 type:complete len:338 (+) Transcript_121870:87-1100(+)